ncbi:MAG TPA: aromatic ring-hydroxylating dioxygenase subunit alpha [Ilumatobacter sp.]|nr:aromatic ring-hydroxylating dioxygenase subunit alpha [Ilumatobacter sp.]
MSQFARRPEPAPLDQSAVARTLAPFTAARTLPRAAYVDPDVLAWERRHLFEASWVCAGRTDQLGVTSATPRAQFATRIGTTGVLLVRDAAEQGATLRAFANICRHRGHELLPCGSGTTRNTLLCPYHGWAYGLDGALKHAPRFGERVEQADDLALVELGVAEWGGWIFVNVDGQAPPLAEHLGGLADVAANWECHRLAVGATHHYELQANWKVGIENYHECYHCPLIHPELSRISPPDSGDNVDDLPGLFVGGTMDLAEHADTMSLDGRSHGVPLPGLTDAERRQVLYFNLFPNLLISLHPDFVMTHRLEPLTPTTTAVECQWLFDPAAVADPGFDPAYAVDFWDLTNRQDWAAVESVQRGLNSPSYIPGVFGDHEDAVYHFQTMVASAYAGLPVERGVVSTSSTTGER